MKPSKVLIVGVGALATLFATRLSKAGFKVVLLGQWKDALDALNTRGAQVEGEQPYPVTAISSTEDCPSIKSAMVLVKSWQTERAAQQLKKCLRRNGIAVSLQNGLGNEDILAGTLGKQHVLKGITTLGATLLAPGIVRLTGNQTIWIESGPGIQHLFKILQEGGFTIELEPDIRPRLWGKLVINAAINPLTALFRVKNGELLSDPQARTLLAALAQETASVAKAAGVTLPFDDPILAVEEVASQTAENFSSMLRDILRGAPTEVDVINGIVVRYGEQNGINVRVNRLVWGLVRNQSRLSAAELSDMVRLV